jgi:prevent-host-death family protein
MEQTITATELARSLSDLLSRVRYRGERFIIDRNGEPTAALVPVEAPISITWRELAERLGDLPSPGADFADDLEAIQASQSPIGPIPWPS